MVKARSIATFLLTNFGSRSDAAQGQILSNYHYTERGASTIEGLSNLVLSVLTQVLTLQLRRSVILTVVAATRSWALLFDALCWNSLEDKPPHHDNVSFIEGMVFVWIMKASSLSSTSGGRISWSNCLVFVPLKDRKTALPFLSSLLKHGDISMVKIISLNSFYMAITHNEKFIAVLGNASMHTIIWNCNRYEIFEIILGSTHKRSSWTVLVTWRDVFLLLAEIFLGIFGTVLVGLFVFKFWSSLWRGENLSLNWKWMSLYFLFVLKAAFSVFVEWTYTYFWKWQFASEYYFAIVRFVIYIHLIFTGNRAFTGSILKFG